MSDVLRSRDINTQQPPSPAKQGKTGELKSMDYHRRVLDKKMEEENGYVSQAAPTLHPPVKHGLKITYILDYFNYLYFSFEQSISGSEQSY